MIKADEVRCIVFDGELLPGINKADAIARLQPLTGLSDAELIDELFSIKPVILKKTPDPLLAQHFVRIFEEAGLQVESLPASRSLQLVLDIDLPFVFTQEASADLETETHLKIIADATAPIERTTQSEENCFRLIFEGECNEAFAMDVVLDNLQHLTGASELKIHEELFSVKPLIIIESPHIAVINEYKYAYQQAGLKLYLENPAPNPAELFKTHLRIRQDSPTILHHKNPYFKVLASILLIGFITAGWIRMQSQWVSPFASQPVEKTISIRISSNAEPTNPTANTPIKPTPVKPEKSAKKPKNIPPVKTVMPAAPRLAVPKPRQTSKISAATTTKKKTSKIQSHILQLERQQYSNQLRLWLAQQQNVAPEVIEQGMRGKVKLLIRIAADGTIINTEVISRSGPAELEKIALDDARNASPYPKIPIHFPEDDYALEVSISYQPTTRN
ncbi:MAG: TonB family protein [Proteobacteria bacterium]|nr:TonB family protein [Pseudomonadota bacterium]